jgi:hypothetical protein
MDPHYHGASWHQRIGHMSRDGGEIPAIRAGMNSASLQMVHLRQVPEKTQ